MSIKNLISDPQFQQNIAAVEASLPSELRHKNTIQTILLGLIEDLSPDAPSVPITDLIADGDVSSPAVLPETLLSCKITAKQDGVVAGLPVAEAVFKLVDPAISFTSLLDDGYHIEEGQVIAVVNGTGSAMLTAERLALNFLGRLSGIATLTNAFVQEVTGTNAVILDTRKTLPGFRRLDKYAVRMGGGHNHRMGLYDMVMIKDNHIDGAGGIQTAVERVRQEYGSQYPIEVEVKNLAELETALALNVDRIMLDNMDLDIMRQAVERTAGRIPLEASGNVSLESIRAIAETGVDFISIGALTHSVPVFDFSMRL